MLKKVLILTGCTGIGKTALSIGIAKLFDMEIISADPVQVFKEFNIGSAKISKEEMENIPHYGIDILTADKEFTVSDFVAFAKEKIEEIYKNGKIPLIVGGTGLYIKALTEGYNFGDTNKNVKFRQEMEELYNSKGIDYLYSKLKDMSPELAEKTESKNKNRIIRALEIATFGNAKMRNLNQEYDFKIISLQMDRQNLYERINHRCSIMIEKGLLNEVKDLYAKYGNCQPMRAIGYKEVVSYILGEISLEQMINLVSQHTRNYAKRQITFMKTIENVTYFDAEDQNCIKLIEENIKKWLNQK